MIVEIDDKTGLAKTYRSLFEFTHAHSKELDSEYEKRFAPKIEVNVYNLKVLQELLPSDASKIKRIHSHPHFIVCNCENGEIYSLNRIGEYPFFKLHLKHWQTS